MPFISEHVCKLALAITSGYPTLKHVQNMFYGIKVKWPVASPLILLYALLLKVTGPLQVHGVGVHY